MVLTLTKNDSLRRRFVFMGLINAICVPFIVPYLLIYSFFRYFEVNPSFFVHLFVELSTGSQARSFCN